jgi:hypothetical protein
MSLILIAPGLDRYRDSSTGRRRVRHRCHESYHFWICMKFHGCQGSAQGNTNPLLFRMLASCTPAPHQGRTFQVTASRPRQKAKNGFVDIFMFDFRYLLELL